MSVLVVGSIALDGVETPFGKADRVLGGSAVFFSAAASLFSSVKVVGVVGDDYPMDELDFLRERGVDLSGVEQAEGESFYWAGRYAFDLNSRETLQTRLGVFADFKPQIPEEFRDARMVFLGNIHPALQMEVLDQVRNPVVVVCDTMNYWIDGNRPELMDLLERVDVLMINDEETRQLANEPNLLKAARWIQERGPSIVVVKKGENGAVLFGEDWLFFVPGYPLEEVFDPTGAGDSFAGGFVSYLSTCDTLDRDAFKRAMVYGSVTGSFAVERFSVDRFRDLTREDLDFRFHDFRELTSFERELDAESE
jgi:sugar/nucleoside kinase (ribokinase family)